MKYSIIDFKEHGDERGTLVSLEVNGDICFPIKRVYYIYNTLPNVRRGFHSHKKLKQVLVCVSGSCTIHLDDGEETTEVRLDKPNRGLYIESDIWREMYDFTEGAVLMVLASEAYDESDYIRDYNDFIKYIEENKK